MYNDYWMGFYKKKVKGDSCYSTAERRHISPLLVESDLQKLIKNTTNYILLQPKSILKILL